MTRMVHVSEINTYLTCRQRHEYEYIEKAPVRTTERMDFGTVVHAGLEYGLLAAHKGEAWEEALDVGCQTAIDERLEEASKFMNEDALQGLNVELDEAHIVAGRALRWLDPTKWETLIINGKPAIEIELRAKIVDGIDFGCKQDWVARNKQTGQAWSFEFKARKQLTSDAMGAVSLQQAAYQQALALNGYPIEGAMEFCILAEMPREPKVNKGGDMSRAACATDWATYEAALLREGLDPAEYVDMRSKLDAKEWFRLVPQYRTLGECQRTWDSVVVPIARELDRGGLAPVPVLAKHVCKGCSFIEPCLEKLRGYPASFEIEIEMD